MIFQFVSIQGLPTPPFEDDATSPSELWSRVVEARGSTWKPGDQAASRLVTTVTILDDDGKPTNLKEETGNWNPATIDHVAAGMDEIGEAEGDIGDRDEAPAGVRGLRVT